MAPRIMVREDPEVSELVAASLRADGVQLLTGHQAVRVEVVDGEKRLVAEHEGAEVVIPFDELLCAVGRSPRVTGYGLEELGIPLTPRKTIETNAYLQTLYPNIYAVGDVAGPFQFTHTAAHQAWYAAVNALVRQVPQVQGRLPRDPLGHLHRPRGGPGRPERERGQGARHRPMR